MQIQRWLIVVTSAASVLLAAACGGAASDTVGIADGGGQDGAAPDSARAPATGPSPVFPAGLGCTGTHATFCADFNAGAVDKGWDYAAPNLRRDTEYFTSGPSSLLIAAPPASVSVQDGWKLEKGLQGSTGVAGLAFDIQRGHMPPDAGIVCARLSLGVSGTLAVLLTVDVRFHRDAIDVLARRSPPGVPPEYFKSTFDAPDPDRFHRVALSVDSHETAPTVRVSFDGIPSVEMPVANAPLGDVTLADVEIGFLDEGAVFEWRVRLDDVTFDFR